MTSALELPMIPDRHEMNPDIFPIGGEVVQSVFEKLKVNGLLLQDIMGSGKASFDDGIFNDNPYTSEYLLGLNSTIAHFGFASRHLVGQALFYAAMRERVDLAGLPRVSKKFVDAYGADKKRRIPDLLLDPETGSPEAVADLFKDVALFRILEPETFHVIEDSANKMYNTQINYAFDYLMAGFAQAYFLYRAAFSSPANYDQDFQRV